MSGTSKYTGVEWSRREQCFKAFVTLNGKKHLCGIFTDEILAVKSRDKAVLKYGLKVPLQFFTQPPLRIK